MTDRAFQERKNTLTQASALGHTDLEKHFSHYISEKRIAFDVLTQKSDKISTL